MRSNKKVDIALDAQGVKDLAMLTHCLVGWREKELERRRNIAGEPYTCKPEDCDKGQAGCEELMILCCRGVADAIIRATKSDDWLTRDGFYKRHNLGGHEVIVHVQFGASVIFASELDWMKLRDGAPALRGFRPAELANWLMFAGDVCYML